ncbi:unnamed protein product [Cyprideis torosa]|uniref:Uncharacterized protein n=1 Tax=Cyprideis torosa TaxID=163714 RepID=A0A7R8WY88_9CRUS|nr:unnamed protein product [Cyprideis torosa]CAG0909209.1 unnamed protein product [Cyprideis torosa]
MELYLSRISYYICMKWPVSFDHLQVVVMELETSKKRSVGLEDEASASGGGVLSQNENRVEDPMRPSDERPSAAVPPPSGAEEEDDELQPHLEEFEALQEEHRRLLQRYEEELARRDELRARLEERQREMEANLLREQELRTEIQDLMQRAQALELEVRSI